MGIPMTTKERKMAIFLISRNDEGALQFTSKAGADTDHPQVAVDRYRGGNQLLAWCVDNPSGALKEHLQVAQARGNVVERSNYGSGWIARGEFRTSAVKAPAASGERQLHIYATPVGGTPMKSHVDPSQPMTYGEVQANAAMILRDGPAKALAKPVVVMVDTGEGLVHPNPFARAVSPDLKASSHQVDPAFALAADRS